MAKQLPETPEQTMAQIRQWGAELGFQQVSVSDIDLGEHRQHLDAWLKKNFHGEMGYMERHGSVRSHPEELLPGTLRVITVRLDYRPGDDQPEHVLADPELAYVARYALGRDYHKLMRKRLKALAERIDSEVAPHQFRAFVDSAPVLERALSERSGQGWIGKNTMLINAQAGSWFFLGEIYTDLPLSTDPPQEQMHCGSCSACLEVCPTEAIVAPFQLDARRCISYLTIEHFGPIPEELRPLMGNRIYGCDDCQLCCPWNKFSEATEETDFQPRNNLHHSTLLELFSWDEESFLSKTEGSAIRRIGHVRWLRNIAVALGNAPFSEAVVEALTEKQQHPEELVREHVEWALQEQQRKKATLIASE